MTSDGKIILDLWDDEPLESSSKQVHSNHTKLTKTEQFPDINSRSLKALKSFGDSYMPQETERNPQSFNTYSTVGDLPRSERPTPQISSFLPNNQSNIQTSVDNDISLRSMPSTRPAPQIEVDGNQGAKPLQEPNKEEVVTKQPSMQEAIDDFSSDWLTKPVEQSWIPVQQHEEKVKYSENRSSDSHLSLEFSYDNDDNLQRLLDTSREEERLRSWINQHADSRLQTRYQQDKIVMLNQSSMQLNSDSKATSTSETVPNDIRTRDNEHVQPSYVPVKEGIQAELTPLEDSVQSVLTSTTDLSQSSGLQYEVLSSHIEESESMQTLSLDEDDQLDQMVRAETLLSELFPSDKPIEMQPVIDHALESLDEVDHLDEVKDLSELPTRPPESMWDNDQDYLEPFSFVVEPNSSTSSDLQSVQRPWQSKNVSRKSKKNTKKSLFKADELQHKSYGAFKPSLILSRSSLQRRQEMSRVMTQNIDRYNEGQLGSAQVMGLATLKYLKHMPIEIAISDELLSESVKEAIENSEVFYNVEAAIQKPSDQSNDSSTEIDSEDDSYLAAVEFQTLLSGSSSIEPPRARSAKGWDLESHLGIDSPSAEYKSKRRPPRLITPRVRNPRSARVRRMKESAEIEAPRLKEQSESIGLATHQALQDSQPVIINESSSSNQVEAALISESTNQLNAVGTTNINMPSQPTKPSKPKTPRPSGHPSVKVRLWGEEKGQ